VDRAHPVERIAAVLDAAGAVCVLTCGADTVAGAGERPVLSIDTLDVSGRNAEPITDADRPGPLGTDNTAYVIFTSGSTGVPKGVEVSHAGLLGLAAAQREVFGLGSGSRVLTVAAPTFDASVFEVILAIGSGAVLVVAAPDSYAGEALTALLSAQQVNAAVLTPTVVSTLDRARLDGLDTLITAGEACPAELVAAWAPGRAMFNAYGPTETTIWATCTAPLSAGQPVDIGAPIPGVCALVLDARLSPAPVGVVGELYLSGPAVAHGYVGRVELTADRFVANPYGEPGTRLYRTGDLVRWTPAGTLDYLGRADTQVKLRGQRIELGEIENTLLGCPQVTHAAASVHHSDTGDHLVGYIALEHTSTADDDAEIVDQWQHIYDDLYGAEVETPAFGMDFRGWNSSYTDEPIPLEEMQEWRAATVDRIMALQPRRVLEIGVGSGLVLSQIGPGCVEYWGTDISASTIHKLQAAMTAQAWGDRVRLRVQPAHVTEGLPQGHFDTIILNSVVQYFPSAGYLTEVIDTVVGLLAPGGALFIGDVRNHSLQGAFHTSVALARTDTTDAAEIRQRVQRAILGEPELLLAPEFFTTWAAEHPSVAGLDIQVKRGSADNELTRYRYDVTIHNTPAAVHSLAGAPTWTWIQCAGLSGLQAELLSQRLAAVRVTEIPRAGVITDVGVEQALAAGLPLPEALAQTTPDTATAEQLHRIGEAAGYRVAVTWGAQPGTLDAVFTTPADAGRSPALTDLYLPSAGTGHRSAHANDPHTNTKISAVRQHLSARLPEYMVPTQIMVLDEFPLTSSGKTDRKALPAPMFTATTFRAPQTPTEKIVAEVFAEVLGLDRAGLDDDFFALGGDSLSAMRLIAAIKTSLNVDLSVPTVFEAPTVRSLSQRLEADAVSVQELAPVQTLKEGSGVPLFCIHPGGGMSWAYHSLGYYLDCPIIGIQQVLQSGEAEPQSVRDMAKNYADRIQKIDPTGPYNLLGWSFGGVVAQALAIELQRRGGVIARLILLDAQPGTDGSVALPDQAFGEEEMLEGVLRLCNIDPPRQDEPLTYEQVEELLREHAAVEFSRYKYLRDLLLNNINTNMELYRDYEPDTFDGDVIIFSAVRDENDSGSSGLQSWRPYIAGDITEYSVDCTHENMLTAESVSLFGQQLKLSLET
jgi:amino acid adenylation domain-containing protein